MKNTVRFLLPSLVVLGLAMVQCGGTDDTAVVETPGAGGAAGFTGLGGAAGVTPGQGGAAGVTPGQGGAAGVTPGQGGAAGVTPGQGGAAGVTPGQGGAAGVTPGQGGSAGAPTDGGTDGKAGDASVDAPVDSGNACPRNQPTSGVACTSASLVCDYTNAFTNRTTACTCVTVSNQTVWACVVLPVEAAAPTCPNNPPADNTRCTDMVGLVCPYTQGPDQTCTCVATPTNGDRWDCVAGAVDSGVADTGVDAATCPATAPVAMSTCTGTLQCDYPPDGACNCVNFGGGTRRWVGVGCN
jgi:hypothetical protein